MKRTLLGAVLAAVSVLPIFPAWAACSLCQGMSAIVSGSGSLPLPGNTFHYDLPVEVGVEVTPDGQVRGIDGIVTIDLDMEPLPTGSNVCTAGTGSGTLTLTTATDSVTTTFDAVGGAGSALSIRGVVGTSVLQGQLVATDQRAQTSCMDGTSFPVIGQVIFADVLA